MPFDQATTILFALMGVVAVLLWMQYAREFAGSLFGKADRADYDAELARKLEEALKRRNARNAAQASRAPDRGHTRLSEPPAFVLERILRKTGLCILQLRNSGGALHDLRIDTSIPATVSPTTLGPGQTGQIVFTDVADETQHLPFKLHYTDDEAVLHAAGWVLDLTTDRLQPQHES